MSHSAYQFRTDGLKTASNFNPATAVSDDVRQGGDYGPRDESSSLCPGSGSCLPMSGNQFVMNGFSVIFHNDIAIWPAATHADIRLV
jgi:hypothetical protein